MDVRKNWLVRFALVVPVFYLVLGRPNPSVARAHQGFGRAASTDQPPQPQFLWLPFFQPSRASTTHPFVWGDPPAAPEHVKGGIASHSGVREIQVTGYKPPTLPSPSPIKMLQSPPITHQDEFWSPITHQDQSRTHAS